MKGLLQTTIIEEKMSHKRDISRGCCFISTEERKLTAQSIKSGHKMEVWDWLATVPNPTTSAIQVVEVRFKNTRKSYYENSAKIELKLGDIIAVEGTPGTDIGIVSMTSELVKRQIKRTGFRVEDGVFKKVIRHANNIDIERWSEAISKEHATMIEARRMSADLSLDMKIGDVEYQGDGMKAIFYYIADGRVDFRELIKILFEHFRVRVEMKQIGVRQEASRIGGIGACGRELCCSSWINSFSTIGIGAARAQDISFNPQKLAGQCGKLKCCLNYEVDSYVDAKKSMPRVHAPLESMDGSYYLVKTDPLAGVLYFSPSRGENSILIPLSSAKVREIQAKNARGEKVAQLIDIKFAPATPQYDEVEMQNIELDDSLTRFDKTNRSGGRNDRNRGNRRPENSTNNNNRRNNQPRSSSQSDTQNRGNDQPQGDRSGGVRSGGDRSRGNRNGDDRSRGEGNNSTQRQHSRPNSDRSNGGRPNSDRPNGGRPNSDRQNGGRPNGERQNSGRHTNRAEGGAPKHNSDKKE